jgi:hypothetical protein
MSKTLDRIAKLAHIAHVDDERGEGNGIIVTLKAEWDYIVDPGCGVRGFDTVAEVLNNTRKKDVFLHARK